MSGGLCAKGMHGMVGDNVEYNGQGREYCKACQRLRAGERREEEAKGRVRRCRKCKANLEDPKNRFEDAKGVVRCVQCRDRANERRRAKRRKEKEAREAAKEMPVVPPAGIGNRLQSERNGLYRLQLMIRQQRGLIPTANGMPTFKRQRGGGRKRT